jgi:hypothetical protein
MRNTCVFYNQKRRDQVTMNEVKGDKSAFVRVELKSHKVEKLKALEPTELENYVEKNLRYTDVFEKLGNQLKARTSGLLMKAIAAASKQNEEEK